MYFEIYTFISNNIFKKDFELLMKNQKYKK